MKVIFLGSILVLASACTTIQSTSLSNVTFSSGTRLTGKETASGFLHLTKPDIDDLTMSLITRIKKGCENGSLGNVQTTLSIQEVIFVQTYEVAVTATCLAR